jgi:hypothetical protein
VQNFYISHRARRERHAILSPLGGDPTRRNIAPDAERGRYNVEPLSAVARHAFHVWMTRAVLAALSSYPMRESLRRPAADA